MDDGIARNNLHFRVQALNSIAYLSNLGRLVQNLILFFDPNCTIIQSLSEAIYR